MTEAIDLARVRTPGRSAGTPRAVLRHVVLVVVLLVMLYPLLWMLASSVKPEDEIFSSSGLWPRTLQLGNYVRGWVGFGQSFGTFVRNSLFIALANVLGNVVSCALAAYAFARLDFPLRRFWFALMLATLMLPAQVLLIPQYTMFNAVGLVNTFYPLFVPHFFATDAFFVFLMVQFIRGLPQELEEAARIDGAGPVRTFGYVVLPLLTPALVSTAIFSFIWSYNDFLSQLVYLSDPALFTVPVGLRLFLSSAGESSFGPLFAMSAVALLPVFLVFLVFQRYLVDGIATTGLKG